jgi:hypothetical protein
VQAATLTVTGKYGKTRELPLHPTVAGALTAYLQERAEHASAADCPALLVSTRGTHLLPQVVHQTFRALTDSAGLIPASAACRPPGDGQAAPPPHLIVNVESTDATVPGLALLRLALLYYGSNRSSWVINPFT